jgi:PAS domain-containing protein
MYLWIAVAASSLSPSLPMLLVIALVGSGGIAWLVDRRSAQASRLADAALNATEVFKGSLDLERTKRLALEGELHAARDELSRAMMQYNSKSSTIDRLQDRIQLLEQNLVQTLQDMNEIVRRMFTNGHTEDYMVERWRAVMTSTGLSVVQTDREGQIVFISDEGIKLFKSHHQSLLGSEVKDIISAKDWHRYEMTLAQALAAATQNRVVEPVRLMMLAADGVERSVFLAIGIHSSTITLILRPIDNNDLPALAASPALVEPVLATLAPKLGEE